jgi:hypothetical protein
VGRETNARTGGALEIEVEGEHHRAPGQGKNLVEGLSDGPTRHVDDHVASARPAPQMRLVLGLETGLSHHVARAVPLEGLLLELTRGDLPDASQQVGRQGALEVVAAGLHLGVHAREGVEVRLHPRQLIEGEVVDEPHGLEARPAAGAAEAVGQGRRFLADELGEHREGPAGCGEVARHELEPEGGTGGGEDAPLAVDDAAPGRRERHVAHRVAGGLEEQGLRLEHLELEQAQEEEQEGDDDPEGQREDASRQDHLGIGRESGPHPRGLRPPAAACRDARFAGRRPRAR